MADTRERLVEIIGSTPAIINHAHVEQIADAILAEFPVLRALQAAEKGLIRDAKITGTMVTTTLGRNASEPDET